MKLVQVGDVYINKEKLSGLTDVQRIEVPGEGIAASYSFTIFLEGSETSLVSKDADEAKSLHQKLKASMYPGTRFSSGGNTLNSNYVNAIGSVVSGIVGDGAGFPVEMDGTTVNLQYPDVPQAEAARKELVAKINAA